MKKFISAIACFACLALPAFGAETKPLPEFTRNMEAETRWAVGTLNSRHYLKDSITDLSGEEMVKAYMRSLDGNRMYFLQEDVDDFVYRFSEPMEKFLDRGNLYPAFQIFAKFRERAEARTEWIRERLEGEFDFAEEGQFAPDRRESDWLADSSEADKLWTDRLKFELLNEVISLSQVRETPETAEAETTPDENTESAEGAADEASETTVAEAETEAVDEDQLDEDALRRLATDNTFLAEKIEEGSERVLRRHERSLRFILERDGAELQEAFVNSMTQLFDPHSSFFSADTLDEFNTSVQNSFVGIGAVLRDDDGYCTIVELIAGGPAEASRQLGSDDQILGVAEGDKGEFVDVIDMRLRHIVNKIKGPKDTIVRLLIRPGDSADPSARREVRLERQEVRLTANLASARVFYLPRENGDLRPLGVIEVPSFYGDIGSGNTSSATTADVRELIEELKGYGVEGIVLDLRSNGGGLLTEAIRLTGLFVPGGPVVQVRNGSGATETLTAPVMEPAWNGPLVVLTSRFSASASEIVAGALRDHRRALVIGDSSTHGKGTVQQVFQTGGRPSLLANSRQRPVAAKITINQFFLPEGDSTQLRGVPSDIVLPSPNEFLPIGESDLQNAIPWKAIEPVKWTAPWDREREKRPILVDRDMVDQLVDRSTERMETKAEFKFLTEQIDWRRERREEKEVSLNLAERIEKRIRDEALRKYFKETFEAFEEENYDFEKILLKVSQDLEARSREIRESDGKDEEKKDSPSFDIHLRETLRILADWHDLLSETEDAPILAALRKAAKP